MKNISRILKVLPLLLIASSPAFAASGGHHEPSITDLIPFWVNFVLFLFLLHYLLNKPARSFWKNRQVSIQDAAERGKKTMDAALERLKTAENKLQSLEAEIEKLKSSIKEEGEREKSEILRSAKERASLLENQASIASQAEKAASYELLRKELADRVMKLTEEKVLEKLTPQKDKKIRESVYGTGLNQLLN